MKLCVRQSDVMVVVAVGEKQAGVKVYVSPPAGNFAGAVDVKRKVLLTAELDAGTSQVPLAASTLRFLMLVGYVLFGPRKPIIGCCVVATFRLVTAE